LQPQAAHRRVAEDHDGSGGGQASCAGCCVRGHSPWPSPLPLSGEAPREGLEGPLPRNAGGLLGRGTFAFCSASAPRAVRRLPVVGGLCMRLPSDGKTPAKGRVWCLRDCVGGCIGLDRDACLARTGTIWVGFCLLRGKEAHKQVEIAAVQD